MCAFSNGNYATLSVMRRSHSCRLNLASFVTTWMEPECDELVSEARNINYIDEAEYPSTTAIQNECAPL